MTTTAPALPYPIGIQISVFRDDGQWNYPKWWMRPVHQQLALQVARIALAHYEGSEDPAYTAAEWASKSEALVEQYPDCIFVY